MNGNYICSECNHQNHQSSGLPFGCDRRLYWNNLMRQQCVMKGEKHRIYILSFDFAIRIGFHIRKHIRTYRSLAKIFSLFTLKSQDSNWNFELFPFERNIERYKLQYEIYSLWTFYELFSLFNKCWNETIKLNFVTV